MNEIWIIDDDPFAAKLTQKQVAACLPEAEVTTHTDPVATWQALKPDGGQHVDLIVLDLRMPTMDGITFVRNLATASYPGKLIFCSGQNDRMLAAAQQIAEGQGLQILGSLQKPTAIEALRQLLEHRPRHAAGQTAAVVADDIERALNLGEFCNYYQPKVTLRDRSFHGVEALVRWISEGSTISPDAFIPVAESAGLIARLTNIVIDQAFTDLAYWQKLGLRPHLSLNLSVPGLTDLTLPDQLLEYCQRNAISPERITLELTESKIIHQASCSLDILSRLSLHGFNLSIDDFGTGYSSLTQLRSIPFNELKIDRSFVTGVAENPSLQAIVNSSISLVRELGMALVAEGVESQADWAYISRAGCDLAQGFFIAKPMPAQAIPVWLELWEEKKAQ